MTPNFESQNSFIEVKQKNEEAFIVIAACFVVGILVFIAWKLFIKFVIKTSEAVGEGLKRGWNKEI